MLFIQTQLTFGFRHSRLETHFCSTSPLFFLLELQFLKMILMLVLLQEFINYLDKDSLLLLALLCI